MCLSVLAASLLIGAQTKLVLEPVESFAGKTLPITAQVVSLTESRNGRHYTILLVTKAGGEKVRFRLRYSGKTPLPAEPYDTVEATLRIDALGESEAARRSYRAKGIFLRGSTYEPITVTPRENVSLACRLLEMRKGMLLLSIGICQGKKGSSWAGCCWGRRLLFRKLPSGIFVSAAFHICWLYRPAYVVVGDVPFSHAAKAKMERRVSAACSMGFVLFFMGLAGFPRLSRGQGS